MAMLNSVLLDCSNDITSWLFEWKEEPPEMAVTRYIDGHPTVYLMPKENARNLWKTLIGNGYKVGPITGSEIT